MVIASLLLAGLFNRGITFESLEHVTGHWPDVCVFRRLTGLLCPGCGMTRSMISFFSYNLRLSFFYHPMGPMLGFSLLAIWFASFRETMWVYLNKQIQIFFKKYAIHSLCVILAWGVLRNILI